MAAEAEWSWADNKIFEDALVKFPEDVPNRWQMIAGCLPGKSPHDVIVHYNALLQDVADIEAGLVQLPPYSELPKTCRTWPPSGTGGELPKTGRTSPPSGAGGQPVERKKGKPWSPEEHMLFLRGLEIYGKSDWRSISRNVVITRLPSQVASHAQKYFNRQKSGKKERKRSSIHDITSVSDFNSNYNYTDSDSPYTTGNNAYPSTEQSPYTTSMAYPSTEILPNTMSKVHPSTELLPYTTSKAYPLTEQSAYTPSMAHFSTDQSCYNTNTSMVYPSEQCSLPYNTSNVYPSTTSMVYPSEQCSLLYNTSNVYPSTEPSPSSMDCLAFGDINNTGAVMPIQDQTDVVPAPNSYIDESYLVDYSFGEFQPLQM